MFLNEFIATLIIDSRQHNQIYYISALCDILLSEICHKDVFSNIYKQMDLNSISNTTERYMNILLVVRSAKPLHLHYRFQENVKHRRVV